MNICGGTLAVAAFAGFSAVAGLGLGTVPAMAVPITYTMQADGASGTLNGVAFSNATIAVTMTADTTSVSHISAEFDSAGTATLRINAGAPIRFSDPISLTLNTGFPDVSFYDQGAGSNTILSDVNSALRTYALQTSIGPIVGPIATPLGLYGSPFPTADGTFVLQSIASGDTSFTASVPEPGALPVFASALIGLCLVRRRRKPQA